MTEPQQPYAFLGVVVETYASETFPDLTGARAQMDALAAALTRFRYRVTVLEDPPTPATVGAAMDGWRHGLTPRPEALVVAWSGHGVDTRATDPFERLHLVLSDTVDAGRDRETWRPKLLLDEVLGLSDQVLVVLDTCRAGHAALSALAGAVDTRRRSTSPGGGTGWLGVLASSQPDEDADGTGVLMDLVTRLLTDGPPGPYRAQWAVATKGISGQTLMQTVLSEWPEDAGQRLADVATGPSGVMFRNPRWRPGQGAQLVEHLVAASRGVAVAEEGWFFTGRHRVLTEIIDWMRGGHTGVLAVTGPAGCGKSAVVGRVAALSDEREREKIFEHAPPDADDPDPGPGSVAASLHLRGLDVAGAVAELAHRLGLRAPANASDLVGEVAQLPTPPVVICDGLDEAAPAQAVALRQDLIEPLGKVALVLLATRDRPFDARIPASPDTTGIGEGAPLVEELPTVSLVDAADTEADIRRYVRRGLKSGGLATATADAVAAAVTARAVSGPGGFLYARIVTGRVAAGGIDVDRPGWQADLAVDIASAFEDDIGAGPVRERDGASIADAAWDLLGALAFAQGRGMPQWRFFKGYWLVGA